MAVGVVVVKYSRLRFRSGNLKNEPSLWILTFPRMATPSLPQPNESDMA